MPRMIERGAWILEGIVFLSGASIGSFVNVVAYRLPRDLSIVRPASFCPHCRAPISFWSNVPVLGYILLRGKCSRCAGRIAPRYFITELGLGLAAVYLFLNFEPLDALARFALCAALFAVSWVDLDWRIIPDVISLPGIAVGIAAASLAMPDIGWRDSLYGMALGGGLFYAIGEAYRWLRGREGMGMGDVKLLAMIGAFLGWQGVIFTIFIGSSLGAVGGIVLGLLGWQPGAPELDEPDVSTNGTRAPANPDDEADHEPEVALPLLQTPVPFGPFLSVAAGTFALFQPQLVRWYLS
jgi:leader peptidase (prepilin peptidase) / N-methyltransferase